MQDLWSLSGKQLLFCEGIILGKSKYEAYKDAGYSVRGKKITCQRMAERLFNIPRVSTYLAQKRQEMSDNLQITLESITDDFIQDRKSARGVDNFAVSVKATTEIAKLHGLYAPEQKNIKIDIAEMSKEQLQKILAE